jgi:hypothetical protein
MITGRIGRTALKEIPKTTTYRYSHYHSPAPGKSTPERASVKKMAAMTNEGPHLSPSTGKRNRPGSPTRPTSLAVSALVFLLAGWRGGRINGVDPVAVLGAVSAVVVLYGLREAAMGLAARSRGLSVRHRA